MTEYSEQKKMEQGKTIPPFHNRFNIEIEMEQVRSSFIARVVNLIEVYFPQLEIHPLRRSERYDNILRLVATELGTQYQAGKRFHDYADKDFINMLHAIEALFKVLGSQQDKVESLVFEKAVIIEAMSKSEVDLEVEWIDGVFVRSGAKLLDEDLLNNNLEWLSEIKYASVLEPFKKGLGHWMEAQSKPERLKDTVTEMYESLEALAKVIIGNNKDLSANREAFIGALNLGDYHKRMLRDYIEYANKYRHALKPGEKRTLLLPNEVETFFYLTGIFIRLAVQQLNQSIKTP